MKRLVITVLLTVVCKMKMVLMCTPNIMKDKTSIWGTKKNTVVANQTNNVAYMLQGDAFGGGDMTRLLNAMLPDNMKRDAKL